MNLTQLSEQTRILLAAANTGLAQAATVAEQLASEKASLDACTEQVANLKQDYQAHFAELSNVLHQAKADMATAKDDIAQQHLATQAALNGEFEQLNEALETTRETVAEETEFLHEYQQILGDSGARLGTLFGELDAFAADIQAQIHGFNDRIETGQAHFNQQVDSTVDTFEQQITAFCADLGEQAQLIRQYIDRQVDEVMLPVIAAFENNLAAIQERHVIKPLGEAAREIEAALRDKLAQVVGMIASEVGDFLRDIGDRLKDSESASALERDRKSTRLNSSHYS